MKKGTYISLLAGYAVTVAVYGMWQHFGLPLLPLVFASGPGSASRQGIGTGVFFGMLVAITVGIVFVPFFFVWIYRIKAKLKR